MCTTGDGKDLKQTILDMTLNDTNKEELKKMLNGEGTFAECKNSAWELLKKPDISEPINDLRTKVKRFIGTEEFLRLDPSVQKQGGKKSKKKKTAKKSKKGKKSKSKKAKKSKTKKSKSKKNKKTKKRRRRR